MNNSEWRKCQDPQAMRFELHNRAPRHTEAQAKELDSPLNLSYCFGSAVSNTNTMCAGYPGSHECAPLHCDILRMAYPTIEDVEDSTVEVTSTEPGDPLAEGTCATTVEAIKVPATESDLRAHEARIKEINDGAEETMRKIAEDVKAKFDAEKKALMAEIIESQRRKLRALWLSIAIRLGLMFLVIAPILWLCLNGVLGPFGLVRITYWQVSSAVVIITILAGFYSKENLNA